MLVIAALILFSEGLTAQTVPLQSVAAFDLGADLQRDRSGKIIQSALSPSSGGITYAVIRRSGMQLPTAAFVSGGPDGQIRKSTENVFYLHAGPLAVLPTPNGSIWCVVGGESIWLDQYDPAGVRIKSGLRVVETDPLRRIVAAGNDEIVFYGSGALHFDRVSGGRLEEVSALSRRTTQGDVPALNNRVAIPLLSENGDVVFVNRLSGELLIFDQQAKISAGVPLSSPHRIAGAATDSGFLYLLRDDPGANAATVFKVDKQGHILATYSCEPGQPHRAPALLAVTGAALYVADARGRGDRFLLP